MNSKKIYNNKMNNLNGKLRCSSANDECEKCSILYDLLLSKDEEIS